MDDHAQGAGMRERALGQLVHACRDAVLVFSCPDSAFRRETATSLVRVRHARHQHSTHRSLHKWREASPPPPRGCRGRKLQKLEFTFCEGTHVCACIIDHMLLIIYHISYIIYYRSSLIHHRSCACPWCLLEYHDLAPGRCIEARTHKRIKDE